MSYIIGGRAHGTTQDVLIDTASTLNVYALQYDTLTNNGLLTYLPGDRASVGAISGIVTGSGAATQMAYWNGVSTLTGQAAFAYDAVNHSLAINANNRYTDDAIAFFEPGLTWLYYYSDARNPFIFAYRSRGTSAAPTAVQSNDILMRYSAAGRYDVNNWSAGSRARIDLVAHENWAAGSEGTRIDFWTTPIGGSIVPAVSATIDSLGIKNSITNTYRTKDYTLTVPATGTAALGTGTQFYVAYWTGTNTLSKLASAGLQNQLLRSTGAAGLPEWTGYYITSSVVGCTLALDIPNLKTLTLSAADSYTLTIQQNLTLAGASGKTLTLTTDLTNNGAAGILTWSGAFTLTVPATGTAALLGTNNNFSVTQYIGDTSNAKMTLGLTINQGAADDVILDFKSSDVAHGVTDLAETDTYGLFGKASATAGGISFYGFTETTIAFNLVGIQTTVDTGKLTSSRAPLTFFGCLKSGTNKTSLSADANLAAFLNDTNAKVIIDAEGTIHHIPGADADIDLLTVQVTGTPNLFWDEDVDVFSMSKGLILGGASYLNETSNAFVTLGMTINQAGNDDGILNFKSSDVTHGFTTNAEADTFADFAKTVAASGGLSITGYTSVSIALNLVGRGTTDITTKSTAGNAYVRVVAQKLSGTTTGDCGADANLFVIRNNATTRFIFDAEGSAHADVEFVTFDKYDDLELLDALEKEFARRKDTIKNSFGEWLLEKKNILQREKVVNFYDEGPRAMVNFTRLAMLHNGAIRQLGKQNEIIKTRLTQLEQVLLCD